MPADEDVNILSQAGDMAAAAAVRDGPPKILDYAPPPPPLMRRDSTEYYREPPALADWSISNGLLWIGCFVVLLLVLMYYVNSVVW